MTQPGRGPATRFVFRPANAADNAALRALLESAQLPFDDVASERQTFIVATFRRTGGRLRRARDVWGLRYCERDTLAMARLYESLLEMTSRP